METLFHDAQDALLKDSLILANSGRPDLFVAGNMFVYYSVDQIRSNDFRGPDVFVVLGATIKPERKSWVVWEENGRLPDVVIEILSESTAHVDRGEKKDIYSKLWRTRAYFLFDPDTEILEGFGLFGANDDYVPLAPDPRGDLPVVPLGIKLGVRRTRYRQLDRNFVRWIAPDGAPLPTAQEQAERERARADAERARADAERARADAAQQRVRELEAQVAQMRGRA
jgi:Uma2 family endonuclease